MLTVVYLSFVTQGGCVLTGIYWITWSNISNDKTQFSVC